MLTFDIVTIFPKFFDSFLQESIIKRAQKQGLIKIRVHDLRKWARDRHRTVDDKPFGGGRGMVLKIEPLYRAIRALSSKRNPLAGGKNEKIILFTPRGRGFSQQTAFKYSKLKRIIMVCGRYEGVDERISRLVDDKVSVGDYVLMGGEVPAMALIEAVSRLIPGVLGHSELLAERIGKDRGFSEYPQYTRPEVFKPDKKTSWKVPKVLLGGHHAKIDKWRKNRQKIVL